DGIRDRNVTGVQTCALPICLQKNPISDAYATAAIVLIRDNLYKAVVNGNNKKVRLAMANASTMAGAAFSNSMVGLVHAIGHALRSEERRVGKESRTRWQASQ